jgi:endoglucanase
MATLDAVVADFASSFGPFTANYGTVTLVGGRARIACATDYEALATTYTYTLVGSSVFAQIFPAAVSGATATASFQMIVEGATAGNRIAIEVNTFAGTISFFSQLAYVDNNAITITYSATTHAWVRLRESGGTVFWETSPDGTTWTNRRTTNAGTPTWMTATSNESLFFLAHRNSGTTNFSEVDNVNVSGVASTGFDTLSADFASTLNPFNQNYGTVSLVSGRGRVACQSAAYSGLQTPATFTLHNSSVFARMYAPVQGGAATEAAFSMFVEGAAGNRVGMAINAVGNTLSFFSQTAFFDAGAITITYSSTTHAWLRLRELSGTIYWETSSDGLTWTSRRSVGGSTPAWITNLTTQNLQFMAHRDSGTVDFGEVDNVNILPGGVAAPSAPTGVTATAADALASVTFTLGSDGGSPITSSTITSSPGSFTGTVPSTGTSGTVSGLANGTSYTFTVTSTNVIGTSAASGASNSVTPAAGSSGGGSGGSGGLNLWRPSHAQNTITGQGANFDIWKMFPAFAWTGSWNPVNTVQSTIAAYASAATAAGQVLPLVVYAYPTTGYSAGGFNTMAEYSAWINAVSAGIGSAQCILCLEPDALGLYATMPDGNLPGTALSYAVTQFKAANHNTEVYIDSSLWLDNNTAATRLRSANVLAADGFSLDVSGYDFQSTAYAAGDGIVSVLAGSGVSGKKYIVDSSRNGNGPLTTAFGSAAGPWLNTSQAWCNPPGRGAGLSPRAYPDASNHPACRGTMWIKSPGESDGSFPQLSDSTYFGEAAPTAGQFWQAWVTDFLAHTNMANLAGSTDLANPAPVVKTGAATVGSVITTGTSSGSGPPPTWLTVTNVSDGQAISSNWGNSVKAATDMLASHRPRFRAYRPSGGVISTSAGTINVTATANLETSLFDNNGMYSATVITVRTSGVWMLGLSAEWLFNATGWRSISINKSDGTYLAGDTVPANGTITGINPSTYQYCTACVALTSGDILQARVAQSSGGDLALHTEVWGLSLCGFLVSA